MEFCMEVATALKSSLRREYLPQSSQQALFDDYLLSHNSNSIATADDFSVDCFFDFSSGEFKDGNNAFVSRIEEEDEDEEEEEEKDSLSVSSQDRVDDDNQSNFSSFSDSFLATELTVPVDDLAELEWVSRFVDDSAPQFPVFYPLKSEKQFKPEPQPILTKPLCVFPAKIPAKARSKRPRQTVTGGTWLIGSYLTHLSSSFASSSSSSCSSHSSPISSSCNRSLVNLPTTNNLQLPLKKPKRKPGTQTSCAGQFQRRCTHCQVQKTPQWRSGPLGAKTLCNACGVRYKSGRLFPEYRPACSPTFSSDVHSNSHRKVVEMRKRKEMSRPETTVSSLMLN